MLMEPRGIDVFYVDESGDPNFFVHTSVTIPLLRAQEAGWAFVWEDWLNKYKIFRTDLRRMHGVSVRRELHAQVLASGGGRYGRSGQQLGKVAGCAVYRWILTQLDRFLPPASIITVTAKAGAALYGAKRLEASLHALFQRMERACVGNKTNALTFFDRGHDENLAIYRKARAYLPTGSMFGGWWGAATKNLPMIHFFKDANFKDSKHSLFVQAADLVAYAALMRERKAVGTLTPWQAAAGLGDAYDDIPLAVLNRKAARLHPKGIVQV
ncbi:MAG: DUF3800 domain-containing protein [Gammaproteobacteria bacterium]